MAIFHARIQVIGRSAGRSVVAAAAYRAAQCLYDEKLGRAHDYTAKAGVVHSEIMLPAGAPTRWNQGGTAAEQHAARTALWNEVDAREKRCDAQLAREMEFAIPRELPRAEAVELARAFVQEQFVARGMVADLNVHWDVGADGQTKPHAHVMLTMRQVTPGGFGPKVREWNSAALYEGVRERWAALANERLAQLGHDVRIDHRSYAEQGIALEPQNKIGPAGARRAVRGEPAERAAEHMEIARRNSAAIIANPGVVLDAITRQHSTFTRADLARFVHRHTADGEQFARAMAVAEASPALVRLGEDGHGRLRLTTREMLAVEQRMERASLALSRRQTHGVLLERRRAVAAGAGLEDEQRAAFGHLTRSRDLSVLVGIAGGGKTTLLGATRRAWEAEGYRVRGATLSGIAAEGLEAGSGIESRTLASLEWGWKEGRDALTSRDVLVVDEAGMVGSRQMERVLSAAQAAGAKVVLVGDPEQLQAIEAGAAFRAIAERVGAAEILETRRQREPWQREATRELATGRTAAALERYEAAGMVHGHGTAAEAQAGLIVGWDRERRATPEQSRVILTYTQADARMLNHLARERLRAAGELGPEQVVQTERGERRLAAGDRVMFLRNERRLGAGPRDHGGVSVKNGTLGTVLAVEDAGARLTVRLDRAGAGGGRAPEVAFSVGDYAALEHGYAATTHKGQGVTADRAHVLASAHMDRHAAYVALSRHRDGVSLHWSADELGSREGMARVLGRERAKDTSLDYGDGAEGVEAATLAYAERRGLDPLWPGSAIVVPPGKVREPPRPEPAAAPAPALAVPDGDAELEALRAQWAEQRERLAALGPGSGHELLERRRAEAALRRALPVVLERMKALGGAMAEMARNTERLASGSLARGVAQAVLAAREGAAPATGTDTPLEAPEPAGPTLVLTEAERLGLRRALSGMGGAMPPAAPEGAPAVPGAKADAEPEHPGPLKPMLPGVPFRPVTAEEVAAVVEADEAVQVARRDLSDYLGLAYRDPAEAARRLVALEQGPGGTAGVAPTLAKRPGMLGKLRGSGWVITTVEAGAERDRAHKAVGRIDDLLVKLRGAEWLAAGLYRNPIEAQRRLEVVEVPGLSPQARQAAEAAAAAGATVGWQGPAPWDTDPPTADDIARAARVAPVWAAIRAKPGLHDELERFMAAARQRLPNHDWEPRDDLKGSEQEVQALSGALHAARALYRCHPGFQAYAAAEPKRQAQAARAEAKRQAEAEQARLAVEEKAQADAKAKAESDARIAAALAHRQQAGPRFSPGMG